MKSSTGGVAALAAVVRTVLADLEGHGRKVGDDARAAVALVDRWIGGEAIDADALGAAAARAHQDGVPFAQREKDRALSWANTAAGNVAYAAQKGKASKETERATMDAAEYALSSLRVEGTKDRAALERLRVAAAASASSPTTEKPGKKQRDKPKPKPVRLKDELDAAIGEVAAARLRKSKAMVHVDQRVGDTELRKFLKSREYPAHASVLAFDARYGGLVVPDVPGEDGADWLFGAHACLASGAHVAPRGAIGLRGDAALVPVIYSPNDVIYFLDGRGAAWCHDTIEGGLERFAADGDRMVARVVLYQVLFERSNGARGGALLEIASKRGEEAAHALGVPAIPEASDDAVRVWGDARALVFEERSADDASRRRGPWTTRIAAAKRSSLDAVRARLN